MDDGQILDLYWERDERAIRETDAIYGNRLHMLAKRIVQTHEDAEESVSDTYLKAWDTIPPQRPTCFFAYLAKICRNFALGRLRWQNAEKRKADVVSLTAEMELCIPDKAAQYQMEGQEIGKLMTRFVGELSQENRLIFLRRYWFLDSIEEIAQKYGMSQSKVKTRLYRIRHRLRTFLEQEGIGI